ncbi:thiopurine S-methyltransferase [Pseudomonas sp. 2FG]|uniref:thiopurine S-methyltransferase n=1 Tax=Pseudomonas sp. 2FG TaxID=2502191 RepID=UPI0010F777D2|nr:thiopurine S-methyltransferase [Pseudomonas sp. 2FG]
MDEEFWQKRWSRNQIGFHLTEINPYLQQHWPALNIPQGARVLVPLCGKSLDLAWLAAQGLQVVGIELAERAVEDFFSEQQLQPQIGQRGAFKVYQAGAVQLWCGDFFALTAEDVADCVALYDRAALIALPLEMRERYATHLASILPHGCEGLLITLDYDQVLMEGPPFAVADEEVQRLLAAGWQLQSLEARDVLPAQNWKFLQRGLDRLDERVYRMVRR